VKSRRSTLLGYLCFLDYFSGFFSTANASCRKRLCCTPIHLPPHYYRCLFTGAAFWLLVRWKTYTARTALRLLRAAYRPRTGCRSVPFWSSDLGKPHYCGSMIRGWFWCFVRCRGRPILSLRKGFCNIFLMT